MAMIKKEKTETAMRRLSKSLRRKFQGASVNISWAELDAFLMAAQATEMNIILKAYNDGYTDCKAGLPNRSIDESNTDL